MPDAVGGKAAAAHLRQRRAGGSAPAPLRAGPRHQARSACGAGRIDRRRASSPAATPPLPRSTSMTLSQACDSAVAVIRPVSPPPMTAMSCIIASSAGKMPVDNKPRQHRKVAAVEQVAWHPAAAGGDVAFHVPDHHRRGEIYVPFFRQRQRSPGSGLRQLQGVFISSLRQGGVGTRQYRDGPPALGGRVR